MRILLTAINAKYIHSNLAVYNLKAVTAKYGDQIEIAEYTINQQPDEILADIYKKQPDVIAFSTYIWNRRMVGELITELSKVLPQAEIWAGGPEVSYDAEAFLMEYPKVRGVMRGEGETVFPALASLYIEGTGSFQTIAGITYRNDQGELQIRMVLRPIWMNFLLSMITWKISLIRLSITSPAEVVRSAARTVCLLWRRSFDSEALIW